MLATMSARGQQLARSLAATLELIKEHEKIAPAEVEQLYVLLVSHIRSARPQSLLAGGVS